MLIFEIKKPFLERIIPQRRMSDLENQPQLQQQQQYPNYLIPQQPQYIYSYQQYPAVVGYVPINYSPQTPVQISAEKDRQYDSGCILGASFSCFFGLLSTPCLLFQTTKSSQLGYLKGMGIMAIIYGTIFSIITICFLRTYSSYQCSNYYSSSYDSCQYVQVNNSAFGLCLAIGIIYAIAGGVIFLYAKSTFSTHKLNSQNIP
jgi:hypothetical protein